MKKSLLVLPAVLLLLAACTPEAGGGGGGNTSTSGGGGANDVKTVITLTAENLLGYDGTENKPYAASGETDKVVEGMSFGFVEIGCYGDGLQWRNKVGGNVSQLFNTSIGATETIEKLVFNYKPEKYTAYAATAELEVMAGTASQKDVATGAGTVFTTSEGVFSYTVTLPAGTKYFKVLKAIVGENNHSVYLNSLAVHTVKPAA